MNTMLDTPFVEKQIKHLSPRQFLTKTNLQARHFLCPLIKLRSWIFCCSLNQNFDDTPILNTQYTKLPVKITNQRMRDITLCGINNIYIKMRFCFFTYNFVYLIETNTQNHIYKNMKPYQHVTFFSDCAFY